jgi:hypothetical protein
MLFPREEQYRAWFEAAGFADVEVRPLAPEWHSGAYAVAVAGRKPAAGPSPLELAPPEPSDARMTPRRWLRFAGGSLAGLAFVPVAIVLTVRARVRRRR